MKLLPLTGLPSVPLFHQFRLLQVDDLDSDFLAQFTWSLVVPSVGRFLANPRPESLVVRTLCRGWIFYPHHLVLYNMLGCTIDDASPEILYKLLEPFRLARIRHLDGLRMNVQRSNLRVLSALLEKEV